MYSEEHRAELLERAYRRGNELRLRRRRWLATLAGVVVIVVAGGSAIAVSDRSGNSRVSVGQSSSSTATTSSSPYATTCAASISVVPRAKVPDDVRAWAQGAAVVGNGALWTIRSAIDVPGSHQSNIWRVKFPWYTRPFGLPTITGRRLDGTGTFRADANPATDSRGTWVVSSFEFSRPGCWQVTSRYGSSTIRFRMHILANAHPAPPSSAQPAARIPPSPTLPATTPTTGVPSDPVLLLALQSDRFDGSSLPAHLHVLGVGRWQYADAGHVGSGYAGSAQLRFRSDAMGESLSSTYDVFMAAPPAATRFTRAYANFRTYGPAGSVRVPQLNPSVNAFCARQAAPPDTTTCWFVRGLTTGIVTATTPSSTSRGDEDAVLQAMLTHLVALGG
ncbi:MAG: hypothetical protein QOI08_3671 [Actinomycetota bacterium]|nr:hypothetical protein [Actinomycetota bacterium]